MGWEGGSRVKLKLKLTHERPSPVVFQVRNRQVDLCPGHQGLEGGASKDRGRHS